MDERSVIEAAEADGIYVGDLGGGTEPDIPRYLLPLELGPNVGKCQFCGLQVRWGTTYKGKRCPFDVEPPHKNHWSTCPKRKAAEKALQQKPKHRAAEDDAVAGLKALGYKQREAERMLNQAKGKNAEQLVLEALRMADQ